jgi:hypothetical protein
MVPPENVIPVTGAVKAASGGRDRESICLLWGGSGDVRRSTVAVRYHLEPSELMTATAASAGVS